MGGPSKLTGFKNYRNRHIGEDINNLMNRADTRTESMV